MDLQRYLTGNVLKNKSPNLSMVQATTRCRQYLLLVLRLSFRAFLVSMVALFLRYYLDTPVPEEIPEKLRVQIIDASLRTYRHLVSGLVKLRITDHFSGLDRKLADWFILTQMTGTPWGLSTSTDSQLKINDTILDGVRVRIYEPLSTIRSTERAVLIFMHGGGWSTLSVDCYDPLIQKVAKESGVVIVSVDYRLSPQYPYPVPLEDSIRVLNYVTDHQDEFRIDPIRVAVGGDGTGGNMAASIALRMRHKIAMQFLVVPFLQMLNFQTSSFIENSHYFTDSMNRKDSLVYLTNYLGISSDYYTDFLENKHTSKALGNSKYASYVNQTTWMRKFYVRNFSLLETNFQNVGISQTENTELSSKIANLITDPSIAPLMANDTFLQNLPEAYIVTCGYDLNRDDGIMYAERLKVVGTRVTHKHYKAGFQHSWFFPHGPLRLQVGIDIVADLVHALRTRL